MKANNLTDQRNSPTKLKRPEAFIPKTDNLKDIPKIPNSDHELKEIVQRAFPLPSVSSELTASIMDKINKMETE